MRVVDFREFCCFLWWCPLISKDKNLHLQSLLVVVFLFVCFFLPQVCDSPFLIGDLPKKGFTELILPKQKRVGLKILSQAAEAHVQSLKYADIELRC